jgi:hypothetical protein
MLAATNPTAASQIWSFAAQTLPVSPNCALTSATPQWPELFSGVKQLVFPIDSPSGFVVVIVRQNNATGADEMFVVCSHHTTLTRVHKTAEGLVNLVCAALVFVASLF